MPEIEQVPWAYGAGAYYRGLNQPIATVIHLLATLAHPGARARPARPSTRRAHVGIGHAELVAVDAVGCPGETRRARHASHVVHILGNRFKVIRKHAALIPAKMVYLESGRDCSRALLIDPTMCVNLLGYEPKNGVSNVVASSRPNDAVAIHSYLVPKSAERFRLLTSHLIPLLGSV